MLISKKIRKLTALASTVVEKYQEYPADYVMIALDQDGNTWSASVVYEMSGDGHPNYVDGNFKDSLILCGFGKSLPKALNKLEKKIEDLL